MRQSLAQSQDPIGAAWRQSWPGLAAILLFSIFINVLKLASPMYVLQILDRVMSSRSLETLFMLTTITLAAIVCAILLEVVRRRMFIHWGHWIERSFGSCLFAAGLKQENQKSASSSRILRELKTIRSFVAGSGLIAWLDIVWAPVFIFIIFLISPPLAYIVLIGSLLALILGTLNEWMTRDARNATYKAANEDQEWIASAERNRETVGSLNVVNSFTELWSRSALSRLAEAERTQTTNVYFAAGMRSVGRFVRIGVLGVGIWLVIDEVLTLGAVIAANILGQTAYNLVKSAMFKWREMVRSRRAYGRIKTVVEKDHSPLLSQSSSLMSRQLILEQVSYRYPGQSRSVLRELELTLNPGELLCVIGSCASGKSTLCRLVSGLIMPRAGKIWLGDVDVYRLQQNSDTREVGYLAQDVSLFQGTVRENIASMAAGNMDLVVKAAKLSGIHDVILNLPEGYDTEIVEKEPLLSAGQRKSIAIARTFYGSPPLIIMDEPMPHLDVVSTTALKTAIKYQQLKGTIIILTTQRKALAKMADKAIWFRDQGTVIMKSRNEISCSFNFEAENENKKQLALVKKASKKNIRQRRKMKVDDERLE